MKPLFEKANITIRFKFLIIIFFLSPFSIQSLAQSIDNLATVRSIPNKSYIRLNYENDLFISKDYYYTQGFCFEWVASKFKKNPFSRIFVNYNAGNSQYGLALESNAYTPTDIKQKTIRYNDRPYASVLLLKSFCISVDSSKSKRVISSIVIGFLGPAALGEEIQSSVHRLLNNNEPQGWKNQIRNDVIINYDLGFDIPILKYKYFSMLSNSKLRIGNYNDKISTGFSFVLGRINDPFSINNNNDNHYKLYIYNQTIVNAIAYDASMSGGMFNRNSPYTLSFNEINNFTLQDNYGIIFLSGKWHFEIFKSYLTREFKKGTHHRWAGVKVGLLF